MTTNFAEREVSRNVQVRAGGLNVLRAQQQRGGMGTTFHIHLRAHRKAKGLTQEQVANIRGVKNNTISGWEKGTRTLDLEDLEKLAEIYGVHPAALLLAPEEGGRAEAMMQASQLASRMGQEAVREWLAVGARMAPDPID